MEFLFDANKKRFHDHRYSQLAVSSELISKYNTLPESTNYECQDTLNVLLHAATSSTDSLESASNDLQRKNHDLRIPSADTIFNYIKENKKWLFAVLCGFKIIAQLESS